MCTNLRITAQDKSVLVGRTMDLFYDLKSQLVVFPRNYQQHGSAPGGKPGYAWSAKYGYVGMNALNLPVLSDGMNEQGLFASALYLPGFTKYQDVSEQDYGKTVAPIEVVNVILSLCANVGEAKELMAGLKVWAQPSPVPSVVLDFHYVVHDALGGCVVFEYVNGDLKTYDNPVGALTNAPTFDWHLTNLANYVNLSANNAVPKQVGGITLKPLGEGSGMLGLPGDFTPPSRFVRAVALTQTVLPTQGATDAMVTLTHILNNFDLILGVERPLGDEKKNIDYTQWSSMGNLSGKRYYVRMHDTPAYGMIDLAKCNFEASEPTTVNPAPPQWFVEINSAA